MIVQQIPSGVPDRSPSLENGIGDTPYGGWDSLRTGGRLKDEAVGLTTGGRKFEWNA